MPNLKPLAYSLALYITGLSFVSASKESTIEAKSCFDQGNAAYTQGRYTEAIQSYEAALSSGQSPELYFNLQEAYLREGLISHALLAYERLVLLAPYSKLRVTAFEKIKTYYQDPPWNLAQRLARGLPHPNGWSWALGSSFWILIASCLGFWLDTLRKRSFYSLLALSLGGLILSCIACIGWQGYQKIGIVLNPAPLKLAPTPQSPYIEILALGTWVKLEKQIEAYCLVTLPHGGKGWIAQQELGWLIARKAD